MKKIALLSILLLLMLCNLFSNQTEDLRFAIGLYSDHNYKLAKTELIDFIAHFPDSNYLLDAKFLLGNSYLKLKEYEKANRIFIELAKKNEDSFIMPDIIFGLAQSEYFLDDLVDAQKLFLSFIQKYSKHKLSWKAFHFLAKIALEQNTFQKAENYLDKAEQKNSDSSITITRLDLYIESGDIKKSAKMFNNVLSIEDNPEKFRALASYLDFILRNVKYREINEVGDIIPVNSQYYPDFMLIKGIALYNLNQYKESLEYLGKVKTEKSEYYHALSLYQMGKTLESKKVMQKLENSNNEEISSNSYFHLAKIEKDTKKAIEKLTNFVKSYPDHKFAAIAHYQIGYRYFVTKEFDNSIEYFLKAKENDLDISIREKLDYLLAESRFSKNQFTYAFNLFSEYISKYSSGEFIDEAFFKMGLIKFAEKEDIAKKHFNKIIEEFPKSAKVGMSYYYLGEIALKNSKNKLAEEYYRKALIGKSDIGFTWERIAYISYLNLNYEEALTALENVPKTTKYVYDVNLLAGKIHFAQRDYKKSLKAFTIAENNTNALEDVLSQKAWTLYKLKRFNESSQIYARLSSSSDSPDKYLFKAATAAFSAENYTRSIELFQQYENHFPEGDNINSAIIGLADAFYNLADFKRAVINYRKLIIPEMDNRILYNALNGLRWSAEQDESIDYLLIITEYLQKYNSKEIRVELLDRKIHFEYMKELWSEVIATAKSIEILAPDYHKLEEILLLKALSFYEIEDYDNSGQVFLQLDKMKPDAQVLMSWAELLIKTGSKEEAITKLRRASRQSRRNDLWLRLLKLELDEKNDFFVNDYNKYLEFAKGEDRQQAELLMMNKQIIDADYDDIDDKLNELSKSDFKSIKSETQFLKGFLLYSQNKFKLAIPELLRVRYLYPEFTQIRNTAEAYAVIAYFKSEQQEEATQLYDVIKDEIPTELKSQIEALIQEGVEK